MQSDFMRAYNKGTQGRDGRWLNILRWKFTHAVEEAANQLRVKCGLPKRYPKKIHAGERYKGMKPAA